MLLFLLFDPILDLPSSGKPRAPVVILVDGSASSKQLFGTRLDSLARVAEAGLDDRFEVERMQFGRAVLSQGDLSVWDRSASAIGGAIVSVAERFRTTGLSAVVMLTDGQNTLGPDPANEAGKSGCPVFPVLVQSPRTDQLALGTVRVNRRAYVGQPLPVEIGVYSEGTRGERVSIAVRDGQQELASTELDLARDGEYRTELTIVPRNEGKRFLKIFADTLSSELSTANNSRLAAIDVHRTKTPVVFVQDRLDWDYTFLSRVIEKKEDMELKASSSSRDPEEDIADVDLSDWGQLENVHVLLLSGIPTGKPDGRLRQNLKRFVEGGGGLAILASERGLSWVRAALPEELVPAELAGYNSMELTPVSPSALGLSNSMVSLGKDSTACLALWRSLPPVRSSRMVVRTVPGAEVLLVARESGQETPVLVRGIYGKGRVLLADLDSFWRWGFTVGGAGKEGVFDGVWSAALDWLAMEERDSELTLAPVRDVFLSGEDVLFSGTASPSWSGTIQVTSVTSGKTDSVALDTRNGMLSAVVRRLPPGTYRYVARAGDSGETAAVKEGEFAVDDFELESSRLSVNTELLQAVAQRSGGEVVLPGSIESLDEKVRNRLDPSLFRRRIRLTVNPLYFVLVVAILACEWLVRRRKGLV
jgi:hypothetical protein